MSTFHTREQLENDASVTQDQYIVLCPVGGLRKPKQINYPRRRAVGAEKEQEECSALPMGLMDNDHERSSASHTWWVQKLSPGPSASARTLFFCSLFVALFVFHCPHPSRLWLPRNDQDELLLRCRFMAGALVRAS